MIISGVPLEDSLAFAQCSWRFVEALGKTGRKLAWRKLRLSSEGAGLPEGHQGWGTSTEEMEEEATGLL